MRLPRCGHWLSLLAVAGILLPTPIRAAEIAPSSAPLMTDVELAADGSLIGMVVDAQGQAVAATTIDVSSNGARTVRQVTDRQGRFRVADVRGGIYQMAAGDRVALFRVWTPKSAPPGARSVAIVVVDAITVRGQTPFPDFFRSDAFLITAVVVAAIAIPVAIHNFRNDQPTGS